MPINSMVCMTLNGGITKCSTANNAIIGIVSGSYGFMGNSQHENDSGYAPVGLVGQLPVFVSTANGEIKAGDPLTSSDIRGVAVKANSSGYIIGYALGSYNSEGVGTINVYARPGWYDQDAYLTSTGNYSVVSQGQSSGDSSRPFVLTGPTGEIVNKVGTFSEIAVANLRTGLLNSQEITTSSLNIAGQSLHDYVASSSAEINSVNDDKITSLEIKLNLLSQKVDQQASISAFLMDIQNGQVLGASTSAALNLGDIELHSATVSGDLMVLGRTTVTDLGVTGNINAGVLAINGLNGEIGTLAGDLYLQRQGLGGVNILDGKVVIDTTGNMTVAGTITAQAVNADEVKANNYNVGGDQSIGSGTIPLGTTFVDISTPVASTSSKIFLTPTSLTDKQITVVSSADGKFRVAIPASATSPISFNWWIVGNR